MKITDYSKIAENYDKNKIRFDILKDYVIEELYNKNGGGITILDLSCGTGNYLEKQTIEYPSSEYSIKWIGIDKSEDMIKKAQKKNIKADLIIADVINMPLEDNSVDYIINRYAFHHYLDKKRAIKEIHRILKNKGKLKIENMTHEYVRYSWVYNYFPALIKLDNDRFPKINEYYQLLENNNFKIDVKINIKFKKYFYKDIIDDVKNMGNSGFHIITKNEYINGLKKIEEDSKINEILLGDIAIIEIYGEKNGGAL